MVEYNCPRCGYFTKRKSCIKDHLYNRKKICKSKLNDLDLKDYTSDIINGINLIPKLKLEKLENELKQLKEKTDNTTNNTTNNITNNTTNNTTNITNNNIINLHIDLNSFKNPRLNL